MADLTNKQRAFVEQYLIDFNATQAAVRAGYSPKTANEQGSRLLANVSVSRAITEHFEGLKMSADQALRILADHANGSLADFINLETKEVDLGKAIDAGKMHLLKKYKPIKRYFKGELVEESVEIELHDPQAAAVWIGKHHKLFTDRVDMTSDGEKLAIAIVKMDVDEL